MLRELEATNPTFGVVRDPNGNVDLTTLIREMHKAETARFKKVIAPSEPISDMIPGPCNLYRN